MSSYTIQYFDKISEIFGSILRESDASIGEAAGLMASAIMEDKLVHVLGTGGHSNIGAYEMFWRAGGLVPIDAILDPGTSLNDGALRSNYVERLCGYAKAVLDAYRVVDGVLIIVNAYGINSMSIEAALEAKERGVKTIGVTSTSFADAVPKGHRARHPSGKSLHEIVDVFVDSHMPYGDALVEFEGLGQKVAPSSTLVNCFTVNLLVVETVRMLLERGFAPPLWQSANVPGGDEANREYQEKYRGRIKHLA
jgi:Uncharacterized protein containing SIS (Sugar ISomerase) phosphosugar binding domain